MHCRTRPTDIRSYRGYPPETQLRRRIIAVKMGSVKVTVKARLGGDYQVITSSITKEAALDLELAVGQAATGVCEVNAVGRELKHEVVLWRVQAQYPRSPVSDMTTERR